PPGRDFTERGRRPLASPAPSFKIERRSVEMFRGDHLRSMLLVGLLAGGVTGCGVDHSDEAKEVALVRPVQDVGDLYRMYMLDNKKPPTKPDDFRRYQDANPDGYRHVKDGEVVVIWGVKLTDLAPEGSADSAEEVLAYEKKVPAEGGTVLM